MTCELNSDPACESRNLDSESSGSHFSTRVSADQGTECTEPSIWEFGHPESHVVERNILSVRTVAPLPVCEKIGSKHTQSMNSSVNYCGTVHYGLVPY